MTITINADDPRTIKAVEIAATAGQWLRCRTRSGQKAYGVPSERRSGLYYLVDSQSCTCPDFQRNGLSGARIGHAGGHLLCKHILAVRLHCELMRAQENPRPSRPRGHLSVVGG